jgi:ribosomal protein S27E
MSLADPRAPFRLKRLECGHEVLADPTAHTVRCAVCGRLVKVKDA